jgi:hypothetical protein
LCGERFKGSKIHHIKKWLERSVEVEEWIRLLDQKREEDTHQDPSKRWREHLRIVPDNQKDSEFLVHPTGMPIDYFDPGFYNRLQPHLRYSITTKKVSLLPDVTNSFGGNPDEKLSDAAFMKKYAESILAKYDLVDEGELEDANEKDSITDHDDELIPYDDEDWDRDDDMADKRQELAAHLSTI